MQRVLEFNAYLAENEDDPEFAALEARTVKATARYTEQRDEWLTWLGDTVPAAEALLELLAGGGE